MNKYLKRIFSSLSSILLCAAITIAILLLLKPNNINHVITYISGVTFINVFIEKKRNKSFFIIENIILSLISLAAVIVCSTFIPLIMSGTTVNTAFLLLTLNITLFFSTDIPTKK